MNVRTVESAFITPLQNAIDRVFLLLKGFKFLPRAPAPSSHPEPEFDESKYIQASASPTFYMF